MISIATFAQHISSQEAMERATKFLNDKILSSNGERKSAPVRSGVKLKETDIDIQSIYAFNVDGGGYVIASADERALPVLGYSDQGNIEWEQLPENMKAWLKSYDYAIATLGERRDFKDGDYLPMETADAPRSPARTERSAIEPLVKTHWFQEEPYWNDIPLYDGDNPEWTGMHCLTGCVATTMAQIMNYHQWPKSPSTGIPAYEISLNQDSVNNEVWRIDSLPPVTFDWDNMLDNYIETNPRTHQQTLIGNNAQRKAVATLMRYCSQSVRMNLSPEASGANDALMAYALYSYFDYAPTAYYAHRFSYNIDEWETLIYNELAAGRPVAYSGYKGPYSGHSFICDGYDGNGLFHINWGYGGRYEGYFSLSVLSPYANWVGFCIEQCAVLGIQPPRSDVTQVTPPFHARLSHDNAIVGRDTVYFYYSFSSNIYRDVTHDYALGTKESDGSPIPRFIGDPSDSIVYDDNWMTVVIDSNAIRKGESMVLYPMVRFRNIPGSDWQTLAEPRYSIHAVRNRDGSFKLHHPYNPVIEIKGYKITKNTGNNEKYLTLTIHNHSIYEFTETIILLPLYYGDINAKDIKNNTPYTIGKDAWYSAAYIRSDDEADVTFITNPEQNGTVRLLFYSSAWGYYYYYDIETDKDSDGIENTVDDSPSEPYYDLYGRNINLYPERSGIYIRGKEKVLINK